GVRPADHATDHRAKLLAVQVRRHGTRRYRQSDGKVLHFASLLSPAQSFELDVRELLSAGLGTCERRLVGGFLLQGLESLLKRGRGFVGGGRRAVQKIL